MFSRISAVRRIPKIIATPKRFTSSVNEGSVAQSKGFNKKEQAHENEYARRQEAEQLQKLRKAIDAKKTELAELEKLHNEVAEKTK